MQLVVTRCDKATLLTVEGMPDAKSDPKSVTVEGQVWGFYDVSKECLIPPYWSPISVPFTVDGATDIHLPVLLLLYRRRLSVSDSLPAEAEKSSSASWPFCHLIYFLTSVGSCVCYL